MEKTRFNGSLFPMISFSRKSLFAAFTLAATTGINADEIRLKDGSVIKGTVAGIEGGVLAITPKYNADASVKAFKFKLEDIAFIQTDAPIYADTGAGQPVYGKLVGSPENITPLASDNLPVAPAGKLAGAWVTPEESPEAKAAKAAERKWSLELFLDVTGKTGNSEAVGAAGGFNAFLTGPDDKLKLYTKANYVKTDGEISSNDLHGGFDYTSYHLKPALFYVRSDNGYDKIKDISFFSTTALGSGCQLLDEPNQHLDFRVGLAYRYEKFEDGSSTDGPGMDVGINYDYSWGWGKFVESFTYTPVFEDFADYLLTNQAYLEFGVAGSDRWKFRLGIENTYESRPQNNRERLDTTYFARIVWLYQ